MGQLQFRRLAYALGATVTGVDLRQPLDDATIAQIRQAWLEYQLLCFPNQDLKKSELLAFARSFGELEKAGIPDPETPFVTLVTEKPVNGRPWNGYKGGQNWHSDKSFTTRPTAASFLNAKEIPEVGGDTMFANTYMAYDALSPTMKSVVDGLSAIHDYELRLQSQSSKNGDARTPEEIQRAATQELAARAGGPGLSPPTVHPTARVHPETGRKAIYLGDRVSRFAGLTEEESKPILDFLKQHAVRYEFTYRHRWQLNDLLMWDNASTLHIALSDYSLQNDPRFMFRCAVVGPPAGHLYTPSDDERVAVPA